MENFIFQIEQGYLKNKNPYHNNMHAADVTQTVHFMLYQLGLMVRMLLLLNLVSSKIEFPVLSPSLIFFFQELAK